MDAKVKDKMTTESKNYRPKTKCRVPAAVVTALFRDLRINYHGTKTAHAYAIGLNYRTYLNILDEREARPDILHKVNAYLNKSKAA